MTLMLRKRFFCFVDWHDGGNGTCPSQSGQGDERGHCVHCIDRFKRQIPQCPLGQRPVMIGRRKRSYNTLDKVMKRLDLIMNTMGAMNFIVIDLS